MVDSAAVERFFTRLAVGCCRSRRLLWAAALLLFVAACMILVLCGKFGSDIVHLFPPGSESGRTIALMRSAGMANSLIVEFDAGEQTIEEAGLEAALDRIAPRLAALPGVRRVDFRYREPSLDAALEELGRALPQLVDAGELDRADFASAAKQAYRKLLSPGPGVAAFTRGDPFGWKGRAMGELAVLGTLSGMTFSPLYSFPVSPDGRRAFLRLDCTVSGTDAAAAGQLLEGVETALGTLPPGVSYRMIGVPVRAAGNAAVLRADVNRAVWGSTVLLLLLFFVIYRGDWRSFCIPLIPTAASVAVLAVLAFCFDELFFFVIGMGGGIVGLAVDHGIHLYAARRGKMGMRRIGRIALPLLLGALTSVGAFLLLATTGIVACTQLGVFAGGSLALSVMLSIVLLPTLFSPGVELRFAVSPLRLSRRRAVWIVGIWLLLLAVAVFPLAGSTVRLELDEFDGSPREVLDAEQAFNRAWRTGPAPAVLLLSAPDDAQLEKKSAEFRARLKEALGEKQFFSPGGVWPEAALRSANLTSWNLGKIDLAEKKLAAAGKEYGFKPEFFAPFFRELREGVVNPASAPPGLIAAVTDRMRQFGPGGASELVFVEDTPIAVKTVRALAAESSGAAVISPEAFRQMVSADFSGRFLAALGWAFAFVAVTAFLFFRSLRESIAALIPVVTTLGILGAGFALFGIPLNLVICFAGIVLAGLTVDYGIYAVYAVREGKHSAIPGAMALSAATTLLGVGSTLLASHPVLFYSGVTLTAGVAMAYLCGVFVVPAFLKLWPVKSVVLLFGLLLLCGCRSDPFAPLPEVERQLTQAEAAREIASWNARELQSFVVESSLSIEYYMASFPLLTVGRFDLASGELRAAGMNPAGMRIFELWSMPDGIRHANLPVFLPEGTAFEMDRDIRRIYFGNVPEVAADQLEISGNGVTFRKDGVHWFWAGDPLELRVKRFRSGWFRSWEVRFYRYRFSGEKWQVSEAVYDNFDNGLQLVLRSVEAKHE